METKYFDDFEIGDAHFFDYQYEVTEEEIMEFGNRFDPQPWHIDKDAANASYFGGLIACSAHIFAMWCSIGLKDGGFPVAAVSALGFNNMKMVAPIRPGDKLKHEIKVKSLRESKSNPGCGVIEFSNEMLNQNDELVFTIEHVVLASKRR